MVRLASFYGVAFLTLCGWKDDPATLNCQLDPQNVHCSAKVGVKYIAIVYNCN